MTRLSATKAREVFSDTLNRVAYGGERIILHRRGRDLAALVSLEDLNLLRELEDRLDLEAARKALKEEGTITWKDVKLELRRKPKRSGRRRRTRG
jgi:prevent-host-death family protein